MVRRIPEQVFAHAVQDNLISRKQFQRLLITVKEVLNSAHRVQLFCPFEESEPEGLLKSKTEFSSFLQTATCIIVACYVCTMSSSECRRRRVFSVNSHYPCKVLKHRCEVEDEEVVHKRSPVILVEQALLGTF